MTRYPLHTKKIACSYTRSLTSLGHQMGHQVPNQLGTPDGAPGP